MGYEIIQADLLDWAASYTGPKYHALISDMPYHLTSIVERFGGENAAPAQHGTDGAFVRASRGFMGKEWDGGDLAFRPETWRALAQHLHPGGFIVAFASSRGYHRMATAMEDAGLLIHPSIFLKHVAQDGTVHMVEHEIGLFGWAFGSGFPKAASVSEKIDKRKKHKGKVIATKKHQPKFDTAGYGYREKGNGFNDKSRQTFDIREPSEDAALWTGMAYGAQAIKPALEPIIIAQVPPLPGSQLDSILTTGAGAYNIDAGRITTEDRDDAKRVRHNTASIGYGGSTGQCDTGGHAAGRWPAHFALCHLVACTYDECAEGCPVAALNSASGYSQGGNRQGEKEIIRKDTHIYSKFATTCVKEHADSGGASRYFFRADWQAELAERLALADPVFYCAKVSPAERDAGLDVFGDTTINDGREAPSDRPYLRNQTQRKNPHPTVKPIALTTWLAALLLPPPHIESRILIPCSGVGSEMIGALKAGWHHITGIEIDPEYVPVAEARLAYWAIHDAPPKIPAREYVEWVGQMMMDLMESQED